MEQSSQEELEKLKEFRLKYLEGARKRTKKWYDSHKEEDKKARAELYRRKTGCTKEYKPRQILACN